MTKQELRNEPGYIEAKQKIINYPKGFEFTVYFSQIPTAKSNALKIILQDCKDEKIIDSISFGLNLQGELCDETFVRL